MSAMRIYNRADFEQALKDNGFVETSEGTSENTLWYHQEVDKHFAIVDLDEIPEFILNKYLSAVDKLYTEPRSDQCSHKQFSVTEKKEPLKIVS